MQGRPAIPMPLRSGHRQGRRSRSAAPTWPAGGPRLRPASAAPAGTTSMFSNCDEELRLWVDGRLVAFDSPTTYPDLHNTRATRSGPRTGGHCFGQSGGADQPPSRAPRHLLHRSCAAIVTTKSLAARATSSSRSIAPLRAGPILRSRRQQRQELGRPALGSPNTGSAANC